MTPRGCLSGGQGACVFVYVCLARSSRAVGVGRRHSGSAVGARDGFARHCSPRARRSARGEWCGLRSGSVAAREGSMRGPSRPKSRLGSRDIVAPRAGRV